jgi:hypothetical protein
MTAIRPRFVLLIFPSIPYSCCGIRPTFLSSSSELGDIYHLVFFTPFTIHSSHDTFFRLFLSLFPSLLSSFGVTYWSYSLTSMIPSLAPLTHVLLLSFLSCLIAVVIYRPVSYNLYWRVWMMDG